MDINIDWGLISGVLSGSLGTIVVKYFLEQRKEKTQHERELFKLTYQRKLELAEFAIGFYNTYLYKIQAIKLSFQLVNHYIENFQNTELSLDHLQKIIDDNSIQISSLFETQLLSVNKIHLYFELEENDFWTQDKTIGFMDLLTKLRTDNETMLWYLELINEAENKNDRESAEYYQKEWEKVIPSFSETLSSLVQSLETDSEGTRLMIAKIKFQLKKF